MTRTALGLLDFLVPKDATSRRLARGIPYGPSQRQRLDVYAPRDATEAPPLFVFIYGGGWNSGDRRDYGFAGRALAALGFLTVIPDYRVGPEVVFPGFVEDCGAAAQWAIENAARFGGEASRVFLGGHSAGAYNAVMLGLDPERFGAPRLAGRVAGVVGLSGPYDFHPFDVKESIDAFGSVSEPPRTQPVNLVTPSAPPMFLAQGERDTIVGVKNARSLAGRLRAAGVAVDERIYPSFGHAATLLHLMQPARGFSPLFADMTAFLDARRT